ncbi:COP3-like protein [Mya arenaria]|uniref:COP3-like protein n=1 Tax=Mya arenaria TaxID=6604 RepID=A0ABY7FFP4_MYAAR|nr:COP3-like protein [Mya arenaria]
MGPGFIILFILAALGPVVAGDCNSAPDINGCSIPWDLPYFYKDVFERDCNRHDICYSCGKSYGISRSACDYRLYRNIKATCNTDSRVRNRLWCKNVTLDYYAAVAIGGWRHYKETSPGWCSQSYVSRCIA